MSGTVFHAEFLQQLGGDLGAAEAEFTAAQQCTTDPGLLGCCEHSLGWIAMAQGDLAGARTRFQRTVELGADTELLIAFGLAALAPLTALGGDTGHAQALAAQAITTAQRFALPGFSVMVLMRATHIHLLCRDTTTAHTTLRQLLDLLHRQGNRQFRAEAFEAAAVLAQHTGDPTRAARYFGVRDAIHNERATAPPPLQALPPADPVPRPPATPPTFIPAPHDRMTPPGIPSAGLEHRARAPATPVVATPAAATARSRRPPRTVVLATLAILAVIAAITIFALSTSQTGEAKAQVDKANDLTQAGRRDEAIAADQQVIDTYSSDTSPDTRNQVAKAQVACTETPRHPLWDSRFLWARRTEP